MLRMAAANERRHATALVVEDDVQMRTLIGSLLLQFGFSHVVGYGQAEPALIRLSNEAFALGIVDLNLGEDDGAKLIAAIRSSSRASVRAMPILVASAATTGRRVHAAVSAGADGILAKPFSAARFERQIQHALNRASARAATPQTAAQATPTSVTMLDTFELD